MFRVFVDDERHAPNGWTRCETIREALRLLSNTGVDELSLDFDPGYVRCGMISPPSESFYSIVLALLMARPEFLPKKVWLHSSNYHLVNLAYDELKALGIQVFKGMPPSYEE